MTMPLRPPIPNPNEGLTICAWCRRWRAPADVQAVQRIATGVVRFLCRRDLSPRCWHEGLGDTRTDRLLPEVPA